MIAVLDASAAIEVVLQRDAADRLSETLREATWVIAPNLLVAEVSNVFWKYHKIMGYDISTCERGIEQAITLPDDYINELDLYREAFALSCSINHSVYDMFYLILARRHNAKLLTMDKKLLKTAQECDVSV